MAAPINVKSNLSARWLFGRHSLQSIQPVAAQTGLLNGEMRRPRPGGARKKVLSPEARLCLAIILAAAAFSAVSWTAGWKPGKLEAAGELGRFQSLAARWWGWQPKQEPGWPETLVVYIFSNTDPEYFNNLKFFLKWGVREGDGAYYIIVVQEGGKSPVRPHSCWAATCKVVPHARPAKTAVLVCTGNAQWRRAGQCGRRPQLLWAAAVRKCYNPPV